MQTQEEKNSLENELKDHVFTTPERTNTVNDNNIRERSATTSLKQANGFITDNGNPTVDPEGGTEATNQRKKIASINQTLQPSTFIPKAENFDELPSDLKEGDHNTAIQGSDSKAIDENKHPGSDTTRGFRHLDLEFSTPNSNLLKRMETSKSPKSYKPGFHRFSVIEMVRSGKGIRGDQDFTPRNYMMSGEQTKIEAHSPSHFFSNSPNVTSSAFMSPRKPEPFSQSQLPTDRGLLASSAAPSVTLALGMGTIPTKQSCCKRLLKFVRALTLWMLVIGILFIGLPILVNGFNNHDYVIWGHCFISGLLLSILIAYLMVEMVKSQESDAGLITYTSIYLCVVISVIISPLISTGVTYGLRSRMGPSRYTQLLAMVVVIIVNGILYWAYLRNKKLVHRAQSEKQRGQSFFYTQIYKEFLNELHSISVRLEKQLEKQKDSPQQNREGIKEEHDPSKEILFRYLNVVHAKNAFGMHCALLFLAAELAAVFGFSELIECHSSLSEAQPIYFIVLFYPVIIRIMRELMVRFQVLFKTLVKQQSIEVLAMAAAAFSWRGIALQMQGYQAILITLLLKAFYKLVAYIIIPYWTVSQKEKEKHSSFRTSFKRKWKRFKKLVYECVTRKKLRDTTRKRTQERYSASIFEHHVKDDNEKQERTMEANRFAFSYFTLELFDIMSIITFLTCVLLAAYLDTQNLFLTSVSQPCTAITAISDDATPIATEQAPWSAHWDVLQVPVIFNCVDVGTEIVLTLIIYLFWRKKKIFQEAGTRHFLRQSFKQARLFIFVTSSFMIYTSSLLIARTFV